MEGLAFISKLEEMEVFSYILKTFFISICIYYTAVKITNKPINNSSGLIKVLVEILLGTIFCTYLKYVSSTVNSIITLMSIITYLYYYNEKQNIGYSILVTTVSISINFAIFFIAIILSFFPNVIMQITNQYLSLFSIILIHLIILNLIFKMRKFKNGIYFFKHNEKNESIDILILNISVTIIILIILISNANLMLTRNLSMVVIIYAMIMFISIQKSLQFCYKQKLLEQELKKAKEEIENKNKEIKDLEEENIKISKNAHTITHKQKSLAHKIEELIAKAEISKEEAGEVKERLKAIEKELYKEKSETELSKTGIAEIDDMLKYMQSECTKNKIDFELQLKGNIHYMINNLIEKQDLETLLADHIKNAIIAINHTDNINRSILVKLGQINEIYSLYIYDSGIEFEKETLENLGKKPSTTHEKEGGTGMGFMNTFDTLRKNKASIIIEEFNKPSKDNYTKVIMIKFNEKNEFKTKSYKENKEIIKSTV